MGSGEGVWLRHRAGCGHFCDEDDDEGNGHAFRGAVPDDDWDGQVGDGERRDWVDGCVAGCWLGFILGAATAMAGMAWWVYGVPAS